MGEEIAESTWGKKSDDSQTGREKSNREEESQGGGDCHTRWKLSDLVAGKRITVLGKESEKGWERAALK